jgi:hypothetical protein
MENFRQGVVVETVLDMGQPIVKNLTQEAREYVNSQNLILSSTAYR